MKVIQRRLALWLQADKPLGSLSYVRAELALKYGGQQFWVTSFDNKNIDCMFIKSKNVPQNTEGDIKEEPATVIFCNPNACFYEYLPYQTEWVDYYHSLGVNLVIWNYRGYGRSQGGHISPTAIMRDGEKVYQYVKSNMVTGKVGIHGESLGGCVASYIAKKCQVDFVFVDRAFASLTNVVYWGFGGKVPAFIFKWITRWDEECWKNFYDINDAHTYDNKIGAPTKHKCYKLFGCDPEDNIIIELASLKTSLARSLGKQDPLIQDPDYPKLKESLGIVFEMIQDFEYRSLHQPLGKRSRIALSEQQETFQFISEERGVEQKRSNASQYRAMGGMTPQGHQQINLLNGLT